ncbi:putative oxidoreductase YncB [Vibrio sp. JCM 19052]|nr:putative oxidoreductase YncB [Vibrio sp. JCM 19052]
MRSVYLSLDPYMRGRMNEGKSYADPVELNDVMVGGTVCQVVESKNSDFQTGEWVVAYTGWQDYALSNGEGLFKLGSEPTHPSYASVCLVCLALPLMWVYWKLVSLKLVIP